MHTEDTKDIIYQALSILLDKTLKHENEKDWNSRPVITEDENVRIKEYTCLSDTWTTWKIELREDKKTKETEITIYIRTEDECCPYFMGSSFCKVVDSDDTRCDYEMDTLFDNIVTEVVRRSEEYVLSNNAHGVLTTYVGSNSGKRSYREDKMLNYNAEAVGNCIKPQAGDDPNIEDLRIPF